MCSPNCCLLNVDVDVSSQLIKSPKVWKSASDTFLQNPGHKITTKMIQDTSECRIIKYVSI